MRALCPGCGTEVIAKCGEIMVWHWAHVSADCDPWSEPESEWHRQWKSQFPLECQEVVIGKHRADVKTLEGVIEFQYSPISPEEIRDRETFYGKMLWVFFANARSPCISISATACFMCRAGPTKWCLTKCRRTYRAVGASTSTLTIGLPSAWLPTCQVANNVLKVEILMTASELRRWLLSMIETLEEMGADIPGDPTDDDPAIQAGSDPDLLAYERSAWCIRQGGKYMKPWPSKDAADLYAESCEVTTPAFNITKGRAFLGRCVGVLNEYLVANPEPEPEPPKDRKPLEPRQQQAYLQYERAMDAMGYKSRPEKGGRHFPAAYKRACAMREADEPKLPRFNTWMRYVTAGLTYHELTREKSPRHGRPHGRSIVKQSQIEPKYQKADSFD